MLPKEILPALTTPESCAALGQKMEGKRVVALWATTKPRSSVAILLRFRRMLQKRGYFCLFLLRSNAVDTFFKIAESDDMDGSIYILDKALLEHCSFIQALFSHDYCCGASILTFRGKLYYFQHNIWAKSPRNYTDLQADGVISPVRSFNTALDPARIPNGMKRNPSGNLLIIPAGYPKLDLLLEERRRIRETTRRLVFYPQILDMRQAGDKAFGGAALVAFLHAFFARYPDWEFVIRPYGTDRAHPMLAKLERMFSDRPFLVDRGEDNDYYLIRATAFMTDMSAAHKNFSYMSLQPSVFFRPDVTPVGETSNPDAANFKDIQSFRLRFDPVSPLTRCSFGYIATTAAAALTALEKTLSHSLEWEASLKSLRDTELCHPGRALDYLCQHMDALLEGRREDDWISLPKRDAPFNRARDWLLFFARFALKNFPNQMPPFLQEARTACGKDPRISLAALRAYVREWRNQKGLSSLHRALMALRLRQALTLTPRSWGIALLRRLCDKNGPDSCAAICLATLLAPLPRDEKITQELHCLLDSISCVGQDGAMASQTACLMLQTGMIRKATEMIQAALPEAHLAVAECQPAIGMYLLKKKDIQKLKSILLQWEKNPVCPQRTGRDLLAYWIELHEKKCRLPCFFHHPEHGRFLQIALYGVPLFFDDLAHARACLDPVLSVMRAEAETTPRLWFQTLAAARLCRRPAEVAQCASAMLNAGLLESRLIQELNEEGFQIPRSD